MFLQKNSSFSSIKDENKQLQQAQIEAMNRTKEKDRQIREKNEQIRHLQEEVSFHVSLVSDDTLPESQSLTIASSFFRIKVASFLGIFLPTLLNC